ncbi:MAG: ABC transporter permease subunit [Clostridia bacterium]
MEKKKKRSRVGNWFARMFMGPNKELSLMEEEQVQSPGKTILHNYMSNKLAMFGTIVFIFILICVIVFPIFMPVDLSDQDSTQKNVSPGLNMMSYPNELKNNVKEISPGNTFGVGLSIDGKVYVWGKTAVTDTIDIADVPPAVNEAFIVDIAVGDDHIAAMDDKGKVYIWGNDRNGQAIIPSDVVGLTNIKQMEAGNQFTAVLTEDGHLYMWGNANTCDIKVKKDFQGRIKKIALTSYAYIVLLDDGSVAYTGFQTSAVSRVPENLTSAGLTQKVIDIAAASDCAAAVTEDGKVQIWGNTPNGEKDIVEHEGKIIDLYGGRYHFTALMDNGDVVSWGDNSFKQATVPGSVNNANIKSIYSGYYQNYAVTEDGNIMTWGLKGYLLGSDNLGRDILTRIVNGGQVTMTVGAVAVIIEMVLGVLLGGIAGYFGGKLDMMISRVAEVIGSLPFLPFALILSAILGTKVNVEQRMYLIMFVLGILGWPSVFRLVRAQMFAQREMEFVTAAKAMGVKEGKIVFKHILPNVLSTVLVSATLGFATSMLTESSLSYLGFGILPPTPTWGNMLTGANDSVVIQQYWWRWVFPALIFGICTICINLIGDGLRDAVDPKSTER